MNANRLSGLLVSVRSVDEARAAMDGGADLIDVKEPSRGSLGRADDDVVSAVVALVNGRLPVSAALGEWRDWSSLPIPSGLAFVKWGLAGLENRAHLPRSIRNCTREASPVLVAYADYRRVEGPKPELLAAAACELRFPAFLIDTGIKDGTNLLDWMDLATLARLRCQLAEAGVAFALAGSLDDRAIGVLLPVAPTWFAVRGAACVGGREGSICSERVSALKKVISNRRTLATAG